MGASAAVELILASRALSSVGSRANEGRRPDFFHASDLASARARDSFGRLGTFGCKPKIGEDCATSTDCSISGDRLCDVTQPGGYCTVFNCEPNTVPRPRRCASRSAKGRARRSPFLCGFGGRSACGPAKKTAIAGAEATTASTLARPSRDGSSTPMPGASASACFRPTTVRLRSPNPAGLLPVRRQLRREPPRSRAAPLPDALAATPTGHEGCDDGRRR